MSAVRGRDARGRFAVLARHTRAIVRKPGSDNDGAIVRVIGPAWNDATGKKFHCAFEGRSGRGSYAVEELEVID